jgi:hypothetical protein
VPRPRPAAAERELRGALLERDRLLDMSTGPEQVARLGLDPGDGPHAVEF